jgi:L-serine/L-threonine ammonia-lyase
MHSRALSAALGREREVWLKLECLQPTATFKLRGLGLLAQHYAEQGVERLVSSSGGNAGLAAAYAGARLGLAVTVLVPSTTPPRMRALLEQQGAEVRVVGEVWDQADAEARRMAEDRRVGYVSPFDHPTIWRGHATMIAEAREQLALASDERAPDAVICAVGGGGLLCGVLEGVTAAGWSETPVVAVETEGAASFGAARRAGEPVDIGAITSVATSLGARKVAGEAVAWLGRHPIRDVVVDDGDALRACRRFADDHRLLVEPACGAALAVVYGQLPAISECRRVLVIVCGGAGVTLEQLRAWR